MARALRQHPGAVPVQHQWAGRGLAAFPALSDCWGRCRAAGPRGCQGAGMTRLTFVQRSTSSSDGNLPFYRQRRPGSSLTGGASPGRHRASALREERHRRLGLKLSMPASPVADTGPGRGRGKGRSALPQAGHGIGDGAGKGEGGEGVAGAEAGGAEVGKDAKAEQGTGAEGPTLQQRVGEWSAAAVGLFPVWVSAGCVVALLRPHWFQWMQGGLIVAALALTMLAMGFTLTLEELKAALAMPRELAAGVALQYTVMPALGLLLSCLPFLPRPFAVGLVLVACCPGGTASNIVTYLARGNVALSVLMTTASTLLAVVMTPLLTSLLAGQLVPVDGRALFVSTLQVVLLPVCAGSLLSRAFPSAIAAISPFSALLAVLTVALIVGSGVASSAAPIAQSSSSSRLLLALIPPVLALHCGGFLLGYFLPRTLLHLDESQSRTISIEVGMQNSILGVVLASQHFASPLVAAPAAVSAVCHSVLGSLLASMWRHSSETVGTDSVPPEAHSDTQSLIAS